MNPIQSIITIMVGAFIFSIGINYFAIPNQLGEGGFTGISLLLYYLFHWSPGVVVFLLNLPLFYTGYKILGKRTFLYTLWGIITVSFFLEITKDWGKAIPDTLLASLFTGVLAGTGLGLIFRAGGTTGGVDIIARIVQHYLGWAIGRTMLIFDFFVIVASIPLIGLQKAMYTLVAVFVGAQVIDYMIEGLGASKAAMIISDQPQAIAQTITQKMNRGVTILKGQGAYTGTDREVLYVVTTLTELPKLKQLIKNIDPYAFVVVHDVREVHGEGFSFESDKNPLTRPHFQPSHVSQNTTNQQTEN